MNKIVFIGDSITLGAGYTPFCTIVGNLTGYTAVNEGVDAELTSDMLARFTTDVIDANPDYVVILGGSNDIGGSVALDTIKSNLSAMCTAAISAGIVPIVCTIPPRTSFTAYRNIIRDKLNAWIIATYGSVCNAKVVDLRYPAADPATPYVFDTDYTDDGTHPNDAGHEMIGHVIYNLIFNPPRTEPLKYQIWAFTSAGVKAAYLHNAFNISHTEKENTAPLLSFSLPASDTKTSFLTSAYEVKIYNTVKEQFEGLYKIRTAKQQWNSSGSFYNVSCIGVLAQLEKTENITYDTTATPKTPTQIITALLALQESTPAITVGTIEPTTTFAFAIENANLLTAVLKLPEYLGGRIEVDSSRALNWWNDETGNPTREIRYKKNLIGVTRDVDYWSIRNRIYAYGDGEGDAQLTLLDAGEAHEYIEDTISQNGDGTDEHPPYGICVKRITDLRITHPSTLLRWAQRYLALYKDPVISYQVDMVNLAAHPDFNFDLENIEVGQIIRAVNSDIALNVNVKVVAVTTDLSRAENISIELANATKSLSDSFRDVQQYQDITKNVACQIGAGQVVVQGTVVVLDWVSAGTTTIDGGNITANTITVAKLTVDPVLVGDAAADVNAGATTISGGKITTNTIDADAIKTSTLNAKIITLGDTGGDSIIKSGNYVADTSGWQIKANGDAEFNNVKIRGTIYACTLDTGFDLNVKGNIKSDNYSVGVSGWKLFGNGAIDAHQVTLIDWISADSFWFENTPFQTANLYTSADGMHLYFHDDAGGDHTLV